MVINKVVYGGDTLIDLTSDTVTPLKLKTGAIAHAANGTTIEGELAGVYYGTTQPSSSEVKVWIDPSGTADPIPQPATNTPQDLGVANVGSSTKYARQDHVHNAQSISDLLSGLGYSIAGLSISNITIANGGYCKIGNLVIVNMRLSTTSTISPGNAIFGGLPLPIANSSLGSTSSVAAFAHNQLDTSIFLTKNGNVCTSSTSATISSGVAITLSCVYLAEEEVSS